MRNISSNLNPIRLLFTVFALSGIVSNVAFAQSPAWQQNGVLQHGVRYDLRLFRQSGQWRLDAVGTSESGSCRVTFSSTIGSNGTWSVPNKACGAIRIESSYTVSNLRLTTETISFGLAVRGSAYENSGVSDFWGDLTNSDTSLGGASGNWSITGADEAMVRRRQEQERIAAEQRRAEEQRRIAAQQEQQRQYQEQQRIAAQQEQQRRYDEQQRIAAQQEQQRRFEEQRRIAAQQDQQRRYDEQQRIAAERQRADAQQAEAQRQAQIRAQQSGGSYSPTVPVVVYESIPASPPVVQSIGRPLGYDSRAYPGCQRDGQTIGGGLNSCPVLKWGGVTYWAYSHTDNRMAMAIVGLNNGGNVVSHVEKPGARYVWRITTEPSYQTVTFWGQGDRSITMPWHELGGQGNVNASTNRAQQQPASQSGDDAAGQYIRLRNRWKPTEYVNNQSGAVQSTGIAPGWWSAMWTLVPADTGFVRLNNRWKSSEFLHNEQGYLASGAIQPGWWSAQWTIDRIDSEYVRIRNRWKTNEYLHVEHGRLESGPIEPGWWSAMWTLETVR